MAEDQVEESGADENDDSVAGKKRVLIIVVAALLAIGIAAGLYFSGILGGKDKAESTEVAAAESGEHGESKGPALDKDGKPLAPVFYELPEFLVNLNTTGKQVSFLKMRVSIELDRQEDVVKLESYMPRVTDGINTYLRELRASDLSGSAGTARLREELMLRLNKAVDGVKVRNVYITNILVQ